LGPLILDPTVHEPPGPITVAPATRDTPARRRPCEPPGSSPETVDFSFPSTVSRNKNTGSWIITSRTHLGGLLEPRACRGDVVLAVADVTFGKIPTARNTGG
jgi:hypothetical protein